MSFRSKLDYIRELVKLHNELDEPLEFAAWINQEAPEVWLVEVIGSMGDAEVLPEVTYSPTREFPFVLKLVAGNHQSVRDALVANRKLVVLPVYIGVRAHKHIACLVVCIKFQPIAGSRFRSWWRHRRNQPITDQLRRPFSGFQDMYRTQVRRYRTRWAGCSIKRPELAPRKRHDRENQDKCNDRSGTP